MPGLAFMAPFTRFAWGEVGGVPFVRSITPLPSGTGDREEKVYISLVARDLGGVVDWSEKVTLERLLVGDAAEPFTCGFC